ncbi:hypothetical protein [Streptomyces hokutonensis]|uniref:hypothetical protein n=1 Tax=Streptomyces hokutonensis TaxID=1306990 RepID=UPI00036CAF65|nr:hypothetical protein [Streptomyces hokutonensis]
MTTPPVDATSEAIAALVEEAIQERAAAYGGSAYQPLWKRPRKPKTTKEKNKVLREQRKRGKAARIRRHAAGQSRRPRARQNRIGSAAARRDARALSRLRYSAVWLD